jgi:ABC-type multidrug transport system fused ATPase/permease subunit
MRYRDGLDPSLRELTCNMENGFKVGIVGRTGAGKSTIL